MLKVSQITKLVMAVLQFKPTEASYLQVATMCQLKMLSISVNRGFKSHIYIILKCETEIT